MMNDTGARLSAALADRYRIERSPSVVVQAPEVVATMDTFGRHWDVHPDGRRFIVAIEAGAGAATAGTAQRT